jgi:hypothetical protein
MIKKAGMFNAGLKYCAWLNQNLNQVFGLESLKIVF